MILACPAVVNLTVSSINLFCLLSIFLNQYYERMKQKIASKENQDDITRLDELRRLLETRAKKIKVQYHA